MPHWKALVANEYITGIEMAGRDVTKKIVGVERIVFEDEKTGKRKAAGKITFEGAERAWVANVTNCTLLGGLFGDDYKRWVGHSVTLTGAKVMFQGKLVDGTIVKGSPELGKPIDVLVELAKKKPRTYTLVPTGSKQDTAPIESHDETPASADREPGGEG